MHTWFRQSTRRADIDVYAILLLGVGQENLGHLRAAAVEETHIADTLHDFAGCLLGENLERRVALGAFPDPGRHFDQFVIGEGAIQFLHDVRGQAGISQHDNGLQRVPQAAQMFLLFLGQRHPKIIVESQNAQAH
jgi:hypothetical protein